jgi:hypothetical protein
MATLVVLLVVLLVVWPGFMATRAEPALRVLGKTVELLSRGAFTCAMLIYAVSAGVGTGMAVGERGLGSFGRGPVAAATLVSCVCRSPPGR